MEKLLAERYEHVREVVEKNRDKLLRLAKSLQKYETLSGENAKRVMEGKEPVMESKRDLEHEKHLSRVVRMLSLADMLTLVDGQLVNRDPLMEAKMYYHTVASEALTTNGKSLGLKMMPTEISSCLINMDFIDDVKQKYWKLLEEHREKEFDLEKLASKYK